MSKLGQMKTCNNISLIKLHKKLLKSANLSHSRILLQNSIHEATINNNIFLFFQSTMAKASTLPHQTDTPKLEYVYFIRYY